jgi:hypothetical protein
MGGQQAEQPQVSPQDRARIERASRQFTAYVTFIRWAANFRADEIRAHPEHKSVKLLSPLQSGRFAFAIEQDTILLGVQAFEAAWMCTMPFDAAYVSDRLYLCVEGASILDSKLMALSLGFFINDETKRARMRKAQFVQIVPMSVLDGRVIDVQRATGLGFPVKPGDVVKGLREQQSEKLRKTDVSRWF